MSILSSLLDFERYPHLDGLVRAEQSLLDNSVTDIDILIGADYYFEIILGEIRRGDNGPVAVQSEFGWLISGDAQARCTESNGTITNLMLERPERTYSADLLIDEEGDELTNAVRKFRNTESIGIIETDQLTDHEFLTEVQFNESRRYQVSLPSNEGCLPIDSGYSSCVSRLRQTHSRSKKDSELLKEYSNVTKQRVGNNRANRRGTGSRQVFALPTPACSCASRKVYYEGTSDQSKQAVSRMKYDTFLVIVM